MRCGAVKPAWTPYVPSVPSVITQKLQEFEFLSVDGLAAAPMQVRRSLSVVLIDEDGATRPVPRLSGNTKSLLMMFVLFTLITAAQWVGGVMAHSLALQADCASMGVDALSYVGNMLAECQTDRRPSTWNSWAQCVICGSGAWVALLLSGPLLLSGVARRNAWPALHVWPAPRGGSED